MCGLQLSAVSSLEVSADDATAKALAEFRQQRRLLRLQHRCLRGCLRTAIASWRVAPESN